MNIRRLHPNLKDIMTKKKVWRSPESLARMKAMRPEYERRWRQRRREVFRAKMARRRALNRETVKAAKSNPCTDCGVEYPSYVMEFDHCRGQKKYTISTQCKTCSIFTLLAEIAKCDLVCSNCHKEREHQRRVKRRGRQKTAP